MWLALAVAAAVGVAASPPACRAGLGAFHVNISDGRRLDGGNHTTHAERVAQRRREWKLRKKSKHAAAEHARAANATCYAKNYPDLAYTFCKDECDVGALLDHFRDTGREEGRRFGCVNIYDHFRDNGREEGRRFGCEAAPLTAAEAARFPRPQVDQGRLHAADGFLAAELARRAPAVPIHDHGPLFFHF